MASSSIRFWKRHTGKTTIPVELSVSASILPPIPEPIQIRVRAMDDGPFEGKHLIIQLSKHECRRLMDSLSRYANDERLS